MSTPLNHHRNDFDDQQAEHFMELCEAGDLPGVMAFLDAGFPVDKRGLLGHTGLHVAAQKNQLDVMSVLIERGISLNIPDSSKNTPLHLAALDGALDACRMLLDLGAHLHAKNSSQETPFMVSLRNMGLSGSSLACPEILLDREPLGLKGQNVLNICTTREQFQWLLNRGADPNETSASGMTPLHTLGARILDVESIFWMLMSRGADLNAKDDVGDTPLHIASKCGNDRLCRLLLDAGANSELTNKSKQTPLACALNSRQKERQKPVILSLIAHGAQIEGHHLPHELTGMTPVLAAVHLGLTPLVIRLVNEDPGLPLSDLNQLAIQMGKEETAAAIQSILASKEISRILCDSPPAPKKASP